MELLRPGPQTRVLDVGVTSDERHRESNYFEQMYPYPQNITCVGTEDGSHLARRYPGLIYQQVRPGEPLPFRDAAVRRRLQQCRGRARGEPRPPRPRSSRELCRVGRSFFITTPDRRFPVEHHTGLPLLHYLPAGDVPCPSATDAAIDHWAEESNLNILTGRELQRLFPPYADCRRCARFAWQGCRPISWHSGEWLDESLPEGTRFQVGRAASSDYGWLERHRQASRRGAPASRRACRHRGRRRRQACLGGMRR